MVGQDDVAVAVAVRGLHKRFGEKAAVDGIDLDVPSGSFYGLVGPNGAGKTTTLSMVTGLLRPDAGQVVIHGVDMWRDPLAAKSLVGVLSDGARLFDRLTGEQLVEYCRPPERHGPADGDRAHPRPPASCSTWSRRAARSWSTTPPV